jgi:hypothetical protein
MLSGQIAALGANARTSREFPVSTGDVLIIGVVANSTGAFRFNFTPSDTSQKYASDLVPSVMLAGTAQNPFRIDGDADRWPKEFKMLSELPAGLFVKNASTITVDVQDTSAAPNTIDIAFYGYRIRG